MFYAKVLARIFQMFHAHQWGRELDLQMPVWGFSGRAPYMEICDCGATRLKED